jgi:hypothetical protein
MFVSIEKFNAPGIEIGIGANHQKRVGGLWSKQDRRGLFPQFPDHHSHVAQRGGVAEVFRPGIGFKHCLEQGLQHFRDIAGIDGLSPGDRYGRPDCAAGFVPHHQD